MRTMREDGRARSRTVCASHPRDRIPAAALASGALLLLLLFAGPVAGQGITFRVAPELSAVEWAKETALEPATFLGGGLTLGFGRYVTLRGSYRTAGTVETAFADAGYRPSGTPLMENRVKTSLFSSTVLFRLGSGPFAPVLAGTGGVLQLDPEGRDRARQIMVGYGGGVDLRLTPWLDGQILLENVSLRLDRSLLARADAIPEQDPDRGVTRSGLGITASFGMRAGAGRTSTRTDAVDAGFGELLSGSTEGLMIPLEIQAGVVRFDDALGLQDQATVGVRAGIDVGPYFGVRGLYWRGVTDAFDAFRGVTGWTGEVQFNVGRVTGTSPYLILGYGQTRFDDDFRADVGVPLEDQNALVLGAGAGIPLGNRARLTVTLRDFVTTAGAMDEASSTGDLRHSFGLSGGISVLLAGGRSSPAAPPDARRAPGAGAGAANAVALPGDSTDYRTGQVIAIPVPREGEIYLRYGPARTLPDSVAAPPAGADTAVGDLPAALRPGATADATVEELRRQVEELAELVRQSMALGVAGAVLRPGGTTVNVLAGTGGAAAGALPTEPLVPALEGRLGRTSLDGNGGLGLGAEVHFRSLGGEGRLLPLAGLEISRADVSTTSRGTPVTGTLRTLATDVGITAVLPGVGPVWPTASVLVTAVNGRASGPGAANEQAMDRLYDGFSVGAGFAVGAGYRPKPDGRTLITTSLRRVWAGRKSRWNLQAGMRLVFGAPSGPPKPGPFSSWAPQPEGVSPSPTGAPALDTVPPSETPRAGAGGASPDSTAATLLARLEALEAQVRQASEERDRATAEAQRARALADSLALVAAEARPDPAGRHADAARGAILAELRGMAATSAHILSTDGTDDGIRIVLGGELFPVGATEPAPSARQELERLAGLLARTPRTTATVEGHTDSTGTEEANLVISRLRAESVRDALVAGGMAAGTVTALGRGQALPVADNATRQGRAQNRRVEVLVRWPPPPSP